MTIDPINDEVEATRLAFREGMARLAAAVIIVTTDGPGGLAGFTASAVCSVTDRPPTLVVCLNRSTSVAGMFEKNRVLCVNTLSTNHEAMSKLFGGATPQAERFAAGEWVSGTTGAPRLMGRSYPRLRSRRCGRKWNHHVLFCRVVGIAHGPENDEALAYFRRRYHHLA
jgi:flavin reductase